MIFKYTFPFATSLIEITTDKQLPKPFLEHIENFLRAIEEDLSNNIIGSCSYNLNHSQPGIPIFVGNYFMRFFKKCLALDSKNSFLKLFSKSSKDAYLISNEDSAIVKNEEIFFDSSVLGKYFILEELETIIKEETKFNHLLIYENVNASFSGKYRWKSIFKSYSLDKAIDFKLQNNYALFETVYQKGKKDKKQFANVDKEIYLEEYILFGRDLLRLRTLTEGFNENSYLFDFKQFCSKEEISAIIVTSEKELIAI